MAYGTYFNFVASKTAPLLLTRFIVNFWTADYKYHRSENSSFFNSIGTKEYFSENDRKKTIENKPRSSIVKNSFSVPSPQPSSAK